jgi:hypothetical protein
MGVNKLLLSRAILRLGQPVAAVVNQHVPQHPGMMVPGGTAFAPPQSFTIQQAPQAQALPPAPAKEIEITDLNVALKLENIPAMFKLMETADESQTKQFLKILLKRMKKNRADVAAQVNNLNGIPVIMKTDDKYQDPEIATLMMKILHIMITHSPYQVIENRGREVLLEKLAKWQANSAVVSEILANTQELTNLEKKGGISPAAPAVIAADPNNVVVPKNGGVIIRPAGTFGQGAPSSPTSMDASIPQASSQTNYVNGQPVQMVVSQTQPLMMGVSKMEQYSAGPDVSCPCFIACAQYQMKLVNNNGGETLKLAMTGMGTSFRIVNSRGETLLTAIRPSVMSRQLKFFNPSQVEIGTININMMSFDIFLYNHQHHGTLSGMRSLVIRDEMHEIVFKASSNLTSLSVEANIGVFPPEVICLICAVIAG